MIALSEISVRVCDIVRKGERLLNPIAPRERERTDLTADTGVASYKTILAEAGLTERTAQRWRAARGGDEAKEKAATPGSANRHEVPAKHELCYTVTEIDINRAGLGSRHFPNSLHVRGKGMVIGNILYFPAAFPPRTPQKVA